MLRATGLHSLARKLLIHRVRRRYRCVKSRRYSPAFDRIFVCLCCGVLRYGRCLVNHHGSQG